MFNGNVRCLVLLCATVVSGCAQLSAGLSYDMAKVAPSGHLVGATRLLNVSDDSKLDKPVTSTLEIRLADYFVKYLQSIDVPEVVVFSRVTVRDPTSSAAPTVYERILLNSEDSNSFSAGNQGAGSTMRDVPLLPAISYDSQDIVVSIRIIEMDADDNARYGELLQTAAATASQFGSAETISVVQATLAFLLANNPDDLEFAYDFGIGPNSSATTVATISDSDTLALPLGLKAERDLTLQPRVGTYFVVKTELPDRAYFSSDRVALAGDSVRWLIANTLKLATLNTLNMFADDRNYDRYTRLFGNPLRPTYESTQRPITHEDGTVRHMDYEPLNPLQMMLRTKLDANAARKLKYSTGQLQMLPEGTEGETDPFDRKTYVAFTIGDPGKGLEVSELSKISDSLETLKLRTTQQTPAELKDSLAAWTAAVQTSAITSSALNDGDARISTAPTASAISTQQTEVLSAATAQLCPQTDAAEKQACLETPETKARVAQITAGLDKDAKRRLEELQNQHCGIEVPSTVKASVAVASFAVEHQALSVTNSTDCGTASGLCLHAATAEADSLSAALAPSSVKTLSKATLTAGEGSTWTAEGTKVLLHFKFADADLGEPLDVCHSLKVERTVTVKN